MNAAHLRLPLWRTWKTWSRWKFVHREKNDRDLDVSRYMFSIGTERSSRWTRLVSLYYVLRWSSSRIFASNFSFEWSLETARSRESLAFREATRQKLVHKWRRRVDPLPEDAYDLCDDVAGQSWPVLYDHRTVSISAISVLAAPSSGTLRGRNDLVRLDESETKNHVKIREMTNIYFIERKFSQVRKLHMKFLRSVV